MPQYHVGHLDLVARIETRQAVIAGLELAGNAFQSVGIPNSAKRRPSGFRPPFPPLSTSMAAITYPGSSFWEKRW
jgi:oxygen-dependent protoporphyrinogen oxidase